MYIKHTRPVTHPANIQIFLYEMVFYLGNLEMNFIGTEAMKSQMKFSHSPSTTPQIEPLIYVPACNIPTMVEAK